MPEFDGFRPEDFQDLAGSTWRGRGALGGRLAAALRGNGFPYQSWGVRRRPELHLARPDKYAFDDPYPCAKLFVYTRSELTFGFYIECPAETAPESEAARFVHWEYFREGLQSDEEMRMALLGPMTSYNLTVADYYRKAKGALGAEFRCLKGEFQSRGPGDEAWRPAKVSTLLERIADLPRDQWVDLHVYATIDRHTAVKLGANVVSRILGVLLPLSRLYELTVAG